MINFLGSKMKRIILLLVFVLTFLATDYAQMRKRHHSMFMMRNKLEQLEKIKLIDLLDMNEKTTLIFFARRHEYFKHQKEIINKRDSLIKVMENEIKNNRYKSKNTTYKKEIKQILNLEQKMLTQRRSFCNSLSDILSSQQIAKLIVFEYRLKREIRNILMKKYRKREMK